MFVCSICVNLLLAKFHWRIVFFMGWGRVWAYHKTPNLSRSLNNGFFGEIGGMEPQYRGCGLNKGFCSNMIIQSGINV